MGVLSGGGEVEGTGRVLRGGGGFEWWRGGGGDWEGFEGW